MQISWTVGRKLYVSFGIIIAFVAISSAIAFVEMSSIIDSEKRASFHAAELNSVNQIVSNTNLLNSTLRGYIIAREDNDAAELSRLRGVVARSWRDCVNASEKLSSMDSTHMSEADKALISSLHRDVLLNKEMQASQVALADEDEAGLLKARSNVTKVSLEAANKVREDASQLEASISQVAESDGAQAERSASTALISVVVCSLLVIGFGMGIAYLISNRIASSVKRLVEQARKISEGNLTGGDEEITSTDEIGDLARAFSVMVGYLQEMAAVSAAIAEGNLVVEVVPRSEQDALGHAFVRMMQGLRTLVSSIRDSASQVASGSVQVAIASQESAKIGVQSSAAIDSVTSTTHEMSVNLRNMVKGTQVQSSSVAETIASVQQMVISIQRIADGANALLDISDRSSQKVQDGVSTMERAKEGLTRIHTSIRSSAGIIDVLGGRAVEIGRIVDVIEDIADQSNLLALNAAIEAARAGELGLGFAVVAEEVRKLAESSAKATKEIDELIQNMQKEARNAVEKMNKSIIIVDEGLVLEEELGAALTEISAVVHEVNVFSKEIGAATAEQASGSKQISYATSRLNEMTQEFSSSVDEESSSTQSVVKAMEEMRTLVQQNSSSSTELAASADQMSKMSRSMLDLMDRFKLEESSSKKLPERRMAASNSY